MGNVMATLVPSIQRPAADRRHFDDVAGWSINDPGPPATYR